MHNKERDEKHVNYSYMSNYRFEKLRKKILKKFYFIRLLYVAFTSFYVCTLALFFINIFLGIENKDFLFTVYDIILVLLIITLVCKIYNWYLKMKLKVFDIRMHYKEKSPKLILEYINHNMVSYTAMTLIVISFILVNCIVFLFLK